MKKQIVTIISVCYECMYYERIYTDTVISGFCNNRGQDRPNAIKYEEIYTSGVPDWCPLENYEEKKRI